MQNFKYKNIMKRSKYLKINIFPSPPTSKKLFTSLNFSALYIIVTNKITAVFVSYKSDYLIKYVFCWLCIEIQCFPMEQMHLL